MRVWSSLVGLTVLGCSGEVHDSPPTEDESESVAEDDEVEVEVGGFSLRGVVHDVTTWTQTGGGLCLSAADSLPLALNESLEISASTTIEEDGTWLLEEVPVGSTTGILLLLEDCGDEGQIYPTASLVLPETWAGMGPGDTVNGVEVFHLSRSQLETWDEALDHSGNATPISEVGGFIGHVETLDGDPASSGYVKGPEGSKTYYHQGEETWEAYSGTQEDGQGRFIVPAPPFGNYTAKVVGTDYMPLILGGLSDFIIYHRWTGQVSNYGSEE